MIIIRVKELLRYQIVSKEELEKITTVPVLGEIPRVIRNAKDSQTDDKVATERTLITENGNDSFNEMVRLLRANLMFVTNGKENKVINVLSV